MSENRYVIVTTEGAPKYDIPKFDINGNRTPYYMKIHSLESSLFFEEVPVFGVLTRSQNNTIVSNSRACHFLPNPLGDLELTDITKEQYEEFEQIFYATHHQS